VSEQLALFSDGAAAPRGLRYQPSFITAQSEHELIAQIRALPLAPFQFGAFEGKRRVASFGWRYDYNQHKLEQAEDLPAWIAPLIVKVQAFAGLPLLPSGKCYSRNMNKEPGSAGTATSRTSTKSLDCRLRRPANFAFDARPDVPGSGSRSKPNRVLST